YNRLDVAIGALYGDGAVSLGVRLGPTGDEERFVIRNDVYVRNSATPVNDRISITAYPFKNVYLRAGLEAFSTHNGKLPFLVGAGISFDDEDIKLLFALR